VIAGKYDQYFDVVPLKNMAKLISGAIDTYARDSVEVVYLHSPKDLNQDHQRAAHATLIACRPSSMPSVRELLAFEVPSSSELGLQPFAPTMFVTLGPDELRKKDAAWQYYAQLEGQAPNQTRSAEGILALEQWRGRTVGANAAEAFEVLRMTR
jgi:N-acetylglucosamine malate deacetylase 1